MDMPVVAAALDSQKRSRDADGSNVSDTSEDQISPVKRICSPRIEDLSISSILEEVVEENGLYELNGLGEVQEKLVYGVMKSLEEEIGVSEPSPSCVLFPEGQIDNSTPRQTASPQTCLPEEFSHCTWDETTSTSCAEQLESFELPSPLESIYSLHDRSCKFFQISALVPGSIHEAEDESAIEQLKEHNHVGIDYLLEASDDELGIAPSLSSRSFSPETNFICENLVATDSGSINYTVHFEPWQLEWDCTSETFYPLAHDHDEPSTDQVWLGSTESPLDIDR